MITFGEKNPDLKVIFFPQIKAEKYLTQQEREKAEMMAKLEMERRLADKVLIVSFLLNRPLSIRQINLFCLLPVRLI